MEKILSYINQKPMAPYQWLIVSICFILNFNDGIDVLLVSYASPQIIKDWGLSKTQMGYIFSAGLLGMTLGAFLLAPLADKYGRKKIFLISIAMISFGLFGAGSNDNYKFMLVFRMITGIGIGGILPTLAATASEFSNQKYRDFNVGLVQAGWPIGAILTGLMYAYFLPNYGWQIMFTVAGCLALLMWILVFFFMIDSLEFMIQNKENNTLEKINRLLEKLSLDKINNIPSHEQKPTYKGVNELFTPRYKRDSLTVWTGAFFGFMTLYTLMSWIPTIAKDSGLALQYATWVGVTLNIGAAMGSASVGAVGNKYGLRLTILTYMIIAFIVMQIYAYSTLAPLSIFILVLIIGFFVQGGFNGIWPTLSRIYPTYIRTTGVGYTVGIGRIGAILGPLIFGKFLDMGYSIKALFILFSIPLLVNGICIWAIKSDQL